MSHSDLMRSYMNKIQLMEDDFVVTCMQASAGPTMLTEGTVLLEGPIADKIKGTVAALTDKYHDLNASLLAKATVKAGELFSDNPKVSGTLAKVGKIAKFGVKNRALIGILVGIVGTLIGMANNPAAASQAATQLDTVLSGTDVDSIIDQLQAAGIDVGAQPDMAAGAGLEGLEGIPPDVATTVTKAAKALRAIDDFEFTEGSTISASSDYKLDGMVDKHSETIESSIRVTTPDGKLVLGEMHSKTEIVDGVRTHTQTHGGVKFDLLKAFTSLKPEQMEQVQDYLNQSLSRAEFIGSKKIHEAEGQGPASAILQDKAEDFTDAFAAALKKQPDGKYRVAMGPDGIKFKKV